jgi:hypothetical protein
MPWGRFQTCRAQTLTEELMKAFHDSGMIEAPSGADLWPGRSRLSTFVSLPLGGCFCLYRR